VMLTMLMMRILGAIFTSSLLYGAACWRELAAAKAWPATSSELAAIDLICILSSCKSRSPHDKLSSVTMVSTADPNRTQAVGGEQLYMQVKTLPGPICQAPSAHLAFPPEGGDQPHGRPTVARVRNRVPAHHRHPNPP
jgi:hypothetical protein